MITILNPQSSDQRIAAFRVIDTGIKKFTFVSATATPAVGEVVHVEAKGVFAIEGVPIPQEPTTCGRSPHRHVRNDSANPTVEGVAQRWVESLAPDRNMCVIPEFYPASIHFDVPVGDVLPCALGDNLIITVRKANGPEEHQYIIEQPQRN